MNNVTIELHIQVDCSIKELLMQQRNLEENQIKITTKVYEN